MHKHTDTHTNTDTHTHKHRHTHTNTHRHTHKRRHTDRQTNTHTHTQAQKHTHTHTNTQKFEKLSTTTPRKASPALLFRKTGPLLILHERPSYFVCILQETVLSHGSSDQSPGSHCGGSGSIPHLVHVGFVMEKMAL